MDPNHLALLQIIVAILQALAAFLVIPFTVYAAIKGAERGARSAYELSESSALQRELRAHKEQQQQRDEQIKSVRLLLGLEIRQNLIDLKWLRDNLLDVVGEETGSESIPDEERANNYNWLEDQQRFISTYMPEWGHRFWYSQQSSFLLPLALNQMEIREISFFHSQLDRLTKIKDMLQEKLEKYNKQRGPVSTDLPDSISTLSSAFEQEARYLWQEFQTVIGQILNHGNPLQAVLEDAGVDRNRKELSENNQRPDELRANQ